MMVDRFFLTVPKSDWITFTYCKSMVRQLRGLLLLLTIFFFFAISIESWAEGEMLPFGHQIGVGDFMGGLPGVAMFDYDDDGDLDIYITNGEGFPNRLLQNDGEAKFIDVATTAGVDDRGRGHGVATADIDNDGDLDIYVANDGINKLYLNHANGKFTDIAESAGVTSKLNSTTCAFADIDNDGYVDLYVGATDQFSGYGSNVLYRNRGNLTFTDITEKTNTAGGYSWAVAFCDYDNDGDQDIFTANDQGLAQKDEFCPIMLFQNNGNLRFSDVSTQAGFTKSGSWMGLAFGDYDLDGDFDLFATNLGTSVQFDEQDTDYHGLYRNNGDGTFTDVAEELGLARWEFGWGTVFTDFDSDGDSDLYYVGNFLFMDATDNPGRFFVNNGDGTFTEPMTKEYGLLTKDKDGNNTIAVGLATGDVNNDGHSDLCVANGGTEAKPAYPILFTERFDDNNWLQLRLEGTVSNSSAVGTRVSLTTDGHQQIQEVASGSSSLSQNSLHLTFGLGKYSKVDTMEIRWPSGIIQTFQQVPTNQVLRIRERDPKFVTGIEAQRKQWTKFGAIKFHVLHQNYPNPFNPETWIPYQLATDAEIMISIYNIHGAVVSRLKLGQQKAGNYLARDVAAYWDGRSTNGESVSSGVYFYQIRANNFLSSRKMVISK